MFFQKLQNNTSVRIPRILCKCLQSHPHHIVEAGLTLFSTQMLIPKDMVNAGFGSYGPQKGDGQAKITSNEQIRITAEKIAENFISVQNGARGD